MPDITIKGPLSQSTTWSIPENKSIEFYNSICFIANSMAKRHGEDQHPKWTLVDAELPVNK